MLDVKDLSVTYGSIRALTGVSLSVPDGDSRAVIGANGAGKSSLARAIAGLEPARSGEILLDGLDITRMSCEARARLGLSLVPEGRGLIASLTVEENLLIGAYTNRGNVKRLRDSTLDHFPQLRPLRRRPARVLSGGELQLLAIGRALMSEPKLLVVDEASMGLSPMATESVRKALGVLASSGISMLIIEQNVRLAFDLCDYIYVFELGHVLNEGPANSIKNDRSVRRAYLGE